MNRATRELIARFTRILGPPVVTPEWVSTNPGQLVRAEWRLWRWRCPACHGGEGDWLHRPLVIDSDDRVFCTASFCSVDQIAEAVAALELKA